jgi:hypothetical protein
LVAGVCRKSCIALRLVNPVFIIGYSVTLPWRLILFSAHSFKFSTMQAFSSNQSTAYGIEIISNEIVRIMRIA